VLARNLTEAVPVFRGVTEMEKNSISNRSRKLFTLSSIYQATRRFLEKSPGERVSDPEAILVREFWTEVAKHIPEWDAAQRGKISTAELRRDTIHAHGVALQALAVMGSALVRHDPKGWRSKLRGLGHVDWSRSNAKVWEGRATVGGRLNKNEANVQLTANVLKQAVGAPLTGNDSKAEARRGRARKN
jgi:DNA sulfur modification protein DndB